MLLRKEENVLKDNQEDTSLTSRPCDGRSVGEKSAPFKKVSGRVKVSEERELIKKMKEIYRETVVDIGEFGDD